MSDTRNVIVLTRMMIKTGRNIYYASLSEILEGPGLPVNYI